MAPPKVQASVTLFGSPPWGFRLSGGKEYNQPLVITRVTPGSLGAKCGLNSGDVLIAVNGQFVAEMTQDECEAKVKQAVGSLHLVVEKNAATVTQHPSGEVTMDADRSVYTDSLTEEQRISRHNRSAKPFPGSLTSPAPVEKASPGNQDSPAATKPAGFRSVSFKPKSVAPPSSNGSAPRGQPDGSSNDAAGRSFNDKPRLFVAPTNSGKGQDLPPPPDFVEAAPASGVKQHSAPSSGTRKVLGPNVAVGLYSGDNVRQAYSAQVESEDL